MRGTVARKLRKSVRGYEEHMKPKNRLYQNSLAGPIIAKSVRQRYKNLKRQHNALQSK